MACWLIILWLRNQPAIGMKRTLGILCGSLVSWMHCAVLPSQGDCSTGVALVAGESGRRGIVRMIGGTVSGTLLRVRHRWTQFVDLSARFVVGLGAFMMGGASDILRRSSNVVIARVGPTLCSLLWANLCWSCVGALGCLWRPQNVFKFIFLSISVLRRRKKTNLIWKQCIVSDVRLASYRFPRRWSIEHELKVLIPIRFIWHLNPGRVGLGRCKAPFLTLCEETVHTCPKPSQASPDGKTTLLDDKTIICFRKVLLIYQN